jgi:hypothetical protein
MAGNSSTYYLGTTPSEGLGDSPRYWYALRKNQDGELFFVRSDQVIDREAYELNIPGPPSRDFTNFEAGTDYFEGIDVEHEPAYQNLKYPQYKWDDRSLFYYVDDEGMFIVRINKGYTYPTGISS